MSETINNKYDDMINMEYHKSNKHIHMSNYDRAAQFSPFAALTGYDALIGETARFTSEKIELSEIELKDLNEKYIQIIECLKNKSYPTISITFFAQDLTKEGGEYITIIGTVKKSDEFQRKLILENESVISFKDILNIDIINES
ncbi:MAG: YolD-like family protein [Lachnospiraceae bacterium]|nr:YolD-like family protein [Lachnospiraceae bacterium]